MTNLLNSDLRPLRPALALLSAAVSLFAVSGNLSAADWPFWRGPARNGIIAESSGWNGKAWIESEPAWDANVGIGSTSPIVVDGRLYTFGWNDKRDTVSCLDAATGKPIWQTSYPCLNYGRHSKGDKSIYSGATSTPTFDAETRFLFTLSIDGGLNCWDTDKRGAKVWSFNLYERYKVKQRPEVAKNRRTLRDYGYTSSPFVYGSWVIVEVGAAEGTLMAFDKRTGARRWVSECKDEAGHSGSPVPMSVEGVPCVAVLTLRNLLVARLDADKEGHTVAKYPWTTDFGNNIPTPAILGNSVIITTAYNHMAICRVKISLKGATKVWEQPFASGVCSPIIHKGHVYWAWRGVHCLDFATGKEKWKGGKVGTAGSCIVTADDRLIVWANRGELSLVETAVRSPGKFKELTKQGRLFNTDAWPNVVLAAGRLYCKDRQGNLKCFRVLRP